jgi:hypothetical protein
MTLFGTRSAQAAKGFLFDVKRERVFIFLGATGAVRAKIGNDLVSFSFERLQMPPSKFMGTYDNHRLKLHF